ncbi:MAG TPA: NAD-dependent epimerase/dehydratase family protein [Gammaproteobacteria bacterium]|nr:NAD-dependent epimerase/dehydratase family protein [Gammaproteobacteria bacterium]
MKNILITGGAGFIGSHLATELLHRGYHVRVLDNLTPQVHGPRVDGAQRRPAYLDDDVELCVGDVRDADAVRDALDGIDGVFHYAAAVGVGQSMYELEHYTSTNNVGTTVLLEALAKQPVEKLVVASSMSLYGEGLYHDDSGATVAARRNRDQLARRDWEPHAPDGGELKSAPTPETKLPDLSSVYALSKFDQERLCLMVGEAYGIPTTALRFFNVYGPYQALSNPYTGVLAIFASRCLNESPPLIFEDGEQRRDFVSVRDIARASRLAYESSDANGRVFNIGSGHAYTIREIAQKIAAATGKPGLEPEITGRYRVGDIRHCFADISRAREALGYEPEVTLDDGLADMAAWLATAQAVDRVAEASAELVSRGLTL